MSFTMCDVCKYIFRLQKNEAIISFARNESNDLFLMNFSVLKLFDNYSNNVMRDVVLCLCFSTRARFDKKGRAYLSISMKLKKSDVLSVLTHSAFVLARRKHQHRARNPSAAAKTQTSIVQSVSNSTLL